MTNKQILTVLLLVLDTLNKKCSYIPTPSVSVGEAGNTYDHGYNAGLNKFTGVIMGMIEDVANFVSVCCGVEGISKIEEYKGGGRCYSACSGCGKECKEEWRPKKQT